MNKLLNVFTDLADGDSVRKIQRLKIKLDKSGSLADKREAVFSAVHALLARLEQENEENVEVEYRVNLSTFDTGIQEVTQEHFLRPEDVKEMFTNEEYDCNGGTSIAGVYTYLDKLFSRQGSGLINEMKAGDPLPILVMITDMEETDSASTLEEAAKRLLSNRFYLKSKRIFVFVGSSSAKKTAAAKMAGGEENVIALGADLKDFLSPVLCSSTLLYSDSSHISNAASTPAETGQKMQEKAEAAKSSAARLSDEELERELSKLLGA